MVQADASARLDAVASACAFLSNVLLRVDAAPAVMDALDVEFARSWPLEHDERTAAGVEALVAAVSNPVDAEALREDYWALFLGPGPMLACPFESVHRSIEHLTFEDETIAVREAYFEFGLQAPALGREPDDHIGLELAFVGELAAAALTALESGDSDAYERLLDGARRFVDEHLALWAPEFAQMVISGARTDLYRAVGLLLAGALSQFGSLLRA